MKRILFIAQQAFPVRSSEGICNSKVAYSLAEAGYLVDVFTYTNKSTYPSDDRIDSLLRNSGNLNIYEISDSNHRFFLSKTKSIKDNLVSLWELIKLRREIGYFYNGMADAYDIYKAVRSHVESFDSFPYDVVITRAYDSEIAAIYLKETYGVKWIANWNDPYPISRFPAPYGKGPNARIKFGYKKVYEKVKAMVDYHTFPCERLRNYLLKSFGTVDMNKTAVIPHMAHSKLLRRPNTSNSCLRIVSCGSVQSPRNPSLFIKALKEVVEEMSLTSNDIKCYFVGRCDSKIESLVIDHHLNNIVHFTGPKQYADCLEFIASCDLSLIIEAQCAEGIYLPTKFVDAVQSLVPVFCVSPQPGTLKDLVGKYHNGYYSNNCSVESIKDALKQAVFDFKAGAFPKVDIETMGCFFEGEIVNQFTSIFNSLEQNS